MIGMLLVIADKDPLPVGTNERYSPGDCYGGIGSEGKLSRRDINYKRGGGERGERVGKRERGGEG